MPQAESPGAGDGRRRSACAGAARPLATLLISESHMQRDAGRGDDAVKGLREAAELTRALAAEDADQPLWAESEAIAHNRLGDALRARGDDSPAPSTAYRASLAVADSLPAGGARRPRRARGRRPTHEDAVAAILEARKDFASALAATRAALALRRGLADDQPGRRDPPARRTRRAQRRRSTRQPFGRRQDRARGVPRWPRRRARARGSRPTRGACPRATSRCRCCWSAARCPSPATPRRRRRRSPRGCRSLRRSPLRRRPTPIPTHRVPARLDLGDARLAQADYADALAAYVVARDAAASTLAADANDVEAAGRLKTSVGQDRPARQRHALRARFFRRASHARPGDARCAGAELARPCARRALMFLGRGDEARALYDKHRGETTYGGKTWEAATREDFANLRAKGLTSPLMDEVAASFAPN